jgi:hypothetical protein
MSYSRNILPKCPICKDTMLSHIYYSKTGKQKVIDNTCNKRLDTIYDINDHSYLVRKDMTENILLYESLQIPARDLSISIYYNIPRTFISIGMNHSPWIETFILNQIFRINYDDFDKLMEKIKLYVTFS